MRRTLFVVLALVALAGMVAFIAPGSGHAGENAAPIFGVSISTGGWGFAQFEDGKPADEAVHETCFPCHKAIAAGDLVFTRYAP